MISVVDVNIVQKEEIYSIAHIHITIRRRSTIKIIALSDTHGEHRKINRKSVPEGDILVHAGDITKHGRLNEVEDFARWFERFDHKHKIVIAGNHDFCFDGNMKEIAVSKLENRNIIYLQDESCEVEDVKIYGSPHSNSFDQYVFNNPSNRVFNKIPEETDILITHGPPKGTLDSVKTGDRIGSEKLREKLKDVDVKAHIFGHVHERYGTDGYKHNVSVLDENYKIKNSAKEINLSKC